MWWHILGVEATDDEKTVKRAYAKVIRGVNQDQEIEMFTKVHHAYREAMKSFKKAQAKEAPKLTIEGSVVWYLDELDKVYGDVRKRLNPTAWKNVFACMSFSEEKHFIDKYIHYFNEHYYLTDEIWTIIEENYPLSNHRDFKWQELTCGLFRISSDETDGMSFEEKVYYVEQKISLYYYILTHQYDKAHQTLILLKSTNPTVEFDRWFLVVSSVMNREGDVLEAYQSMKHLNDISDDVNYYLGGFYNSQLNFAKSSEYLNRLDEKGNVGIVNLKLDNQLKKGSDMTMAAFYPWNEIESTPDKVRKLFSKGAHIKASQIMNAQLLKIAKGGN